MKKIIFISFILIFTACAPMGKSYYKFKHSGAEYFNESCRGSSGVPSIIYFEFNGIYLSAEIDKSYEKLKIGVHIPENKTAQLLSKDLKIQLYINDNEKIKILPLVPTKRQEEYSSMPYEFHTKDPFNEIDYFGKLSGATRIIKFKLVGSDRTAYKWYQYTINLNLSNLQKGTIEFPKIKVNNEIFKGPKIQFEENTHIWVAPINC